MERKGAFDYILLETSGLADPGNIAPLFWVDDGLGSTIYLDGIATLVDAKNILRSLEETAEPYPFDGAVRDGEETLAHLQISHADVIILNKADTVSGAELQRVKARIRGINGLARVEVTEYGRVPQLEGTILDLHAYTEVASLGASDPGHGHLDPVSVSGPFQRPTSIDEEQSISTVAFRTPVLEPSQLERLDAWLRLILWEGALPVAGGGSQPSNATIYRLKGRQPLTDGTVMMIQGVREVFEITETTRAGANWGGKIVIIGKQLQGIAWEASLGQYIASTRPSASVG